MKHLKLVRPVVPATRNTEAANMLFELHNTLNKIIGTMALGIHDGTVPRERGLLQCRREIISATESVIGPLLEEKP